MVKKGSKVKTLDPEALERKRAADAEESMRMERVRKANQLKRDCELQKRDHDQFLMEREKINYFWIVERKALAEQEAELRNKAREYQDLEERQQIELKMIQQKLKHLRYHHLDEVVELKTDAELALKFQEDHHRITEAEIRKDTRSLKAEVRDADVAHEDFVRMLKREQDRNIHDLRQEFDRKARDAQRQCDERLKEARGDLDQHRKNQVKKIDEVKNSKVKELTQKNQKQILEMKTYFVDIKNSNYDLIKRLTDERDTAGIHMNEEAKKMSVLLTKNSQLKEPLARANQDVERLEAELLAYTEEKKEMAMQRERVKRQETQLRRMDFQHEVLQQQLAATSAERDELQFKFQHGIHNVQQKAGLKNLVLEKKIDTAEESLEMTDAQLAQIMSSAGVDSATVLGISQQLAEVIGWKDEIIGEFQQEVDRIRGLHRTLVKTYECKLAEHGVPPVELGFAPAVF